MSVYSALADTGSETCSGIVMAAFAFVEKWKTAIPETFVVARGLVARAVETAKPEYGEIPPRSEDMAARPT
jgi:hypothetical protein